MEPHRTLRNLSLDMNTRGNAPRGYSLTIADWLQPSPIRSCISLCASWLGRPTLLATDQLWTSRQPFFIASTLRNTLPLHSAIPCHYTPQYLATAGVV
jgi:hypothetical protein